MLMLPPSHPRLGFMLLVQKQKAEKQAADAAAAEATGGSAPSASAPSGLVRRLSFGRKKA